VAKKVAVALAGGVGARVGPTVPKQLIKIAGRTILEHTLASLEGHELVDEIIVMMATGHLDAVREITRDGDYVKVVSILEGADTRNGTTERALDAISDPDTKILFHDAVRRWSARGSSPTASTHWTAMTPWMSPSHRRTRSSSRTRTISSATCR
jgi:2-C-methyl-D-erythritol 4-phosphate cytidylyltransferase